MSWRKLLPLWWHGDFQTPLEVTKLTSSTPQYRLSHLPSAQYESKWSCFGRQGLHTQKAGLIAHVQVHHPLMSLGPSCYQVWHCNCCCLICCWILTSLVMVISQLMLDETTTYVTWGRNTAGISAKQNKKMFFAHLEVFWGCLQLWL